MRIYALRKIRKFYSHLAVKSDGLTVIFLLVSVFCLQPVWANTILMAYCSMTYKETGDCPSKMCRLIDKDSSKICLPTECKEITADECPLDFCTVMVDCANEKICHDQMKQEPPKCGKLAYEGQEVECCKGFVKRCGIEFLEGFCDMEGKNSIYNLPLCIPCGDGICGQFENRCNCPEDCGESL